MYKRQAKIRALDRAERVNLSWDVPAVLGELGKDCLNRFESRLGEIRARLLQRGAAPASAALTAFFAAFDFLPTAASDPG